MEKPEKDLVWLHGQIKSPPFSEDARVEAGVLLRRLQKGEKLSMPQSRPMPTVGPGCHELRIRDSDATWRVFYFIDSDAIVLLEVTENTTKKTPQSVLNNCKRRLENYKKSRE